MPGYAAVSRSSGSPARFFSPASARGTKPLSTARSRSATPGSPCSAPRGLRPGAVAVASPSSASRPNALSGSSTCRSSNFLPPPLWIVLLHPTRVSPRKAGALYRRRAPALHSADAARDYAGVRSPGTICQAAGRADFGRHRSTTSHPASTRAAPTHAREARLSSSERNKPRIMSVTPVPPSAAKHHATRAGVWERELLHRRAPHGRERAAPSGADSASRSGRGRRPESSATICEAAGGWLRAQLGTRQE